MLYRFILLSVFLPSISFAQLDLQKVHERSALAKKYHVRTWTEDQTIYRSRFDKWDSAEHRVNIASFDTSGRLLTDTCFDGYVAMETYYYDVRGNIIRWIDHYYSHADSAELDQIGFVPPKRRSKLYWKSDHARPLSDSSALLTFRDELQYDDHDSLIRHDEYLSGELDVTHTYLYENSTRRLVKDIEDHPAGHVTSGRTTTSYFYDSLGRVIKSLKRQKGDRDDITQYVYDSSSRLPSREISAQIKTDTYRIYYDEKGRERFRYTPTFFGDKLYGRWHGYDSLDRPTAALSYVADSLHNLFDPDEWQRVGVSWGGRDYEYDDATALPSKHREWRDSYTVTRCKYEFW